MPAKMHRARRRTSWTSCTLPKANLCRGLPAAHSWPPPINQKHPSRDAMFFGQNCPPNARNYHLPPARNQYMLEHSWGNQFSAQNTCGACICARANTGKILRNCFPQICQINLGEFISVRTHAAPAFAPAQIQEKILVNYLICVGFVPAGT